MAIAEQTLNPYAWLNQATRKMNPRQRAEFIYLHTDLWPMVTIRHNGDITVPSISVPGVTHVIRDGVCSCPALVSCWHESLDRKSVV